MKNPELLVDELCEQGFHIIEDFLEQSQCDSLATLAQELYQQGSFRGAKIGRQIDLQQNSAIRMDEILWLENQETNPTIQVFLILIKQLTQLLNRTLFLGLNEFETHFASYQAGTFYKKHIDQFAHQKSRRISFVYYLNKEWLSEYGGELKLYNNENQLLQTVLPKGNRFICFNSDIPHEVSITLQPRFSIAGWLKTRP